MNKHRVKVKLIGWLPSLTIMGIFFLVSHQPGDRIPMPGFWNADKLLHFLAYAVLGGCLALVPLFANIFSLIINNPSDKNLTTKNASMDVHQTEEYFYPSNHSFWNKHRYIIGILYGALDEFHQSFIPMRQMSLGDFIADAAGVLAGYFGVRWLIKKFNLQAF